MITKKRTLDHLFPIKMYISAIKPDIVEVLEKCRDEELADRREKRKKAAEEEAAKKAEEEKEKNKTENKEQEQMEVCSVICALWNGCSM